MVETIISRFNDHEADTIEKHQSIVVDEEHVWWGWWKKQHEDPRLATLEALADDLPCDIYLLCRGDERAYTARCEVVDYHDEGERKPSPDPEKTPDYYDDSEHPAWFKLSSIEEMPFDQFRDRVGGVPKGDPSLFVLRESTDEIAGDQDFTDYEAVDAPGGTILHLSDLHFGEYHDYSLETTTQRDPCLLDVLTERIDELDANIGVVVVSGDLTSRGNSNYLIKAGNFIENLLDHLDLTTDHLVVVPGNHDIWTEEEETATRDFALEEPYREFLRSRLDTEEIRQLRKYRLPGDWEVIFAGLKSVRPREDNLMHLGYVGRDRSKPLLDVVEADTPDGSPVANRHLSFAVMHHHVLPTEQVARPGEHGEVSITLDAGRLIKEFKQADIDVVLHGHKHLPFIGSTDRMRLDASAGETLDNPMYVFGSGSAGVSSNRLPHELRNNTFSLYTPKDTHLRVRVMEFNHRIGPSVLVDTELPIE